MGKKSWQIALIVLLLVGFVNAAEFGYDDPLLPKLNSKIKSTTTSVSGGFDGNASSICSGDEVLLGNGTCVSSATFGGGGGGDITAVNTDGIYLTGGATSGAADLLLDEVVLNSTINSSIFSIVTQAFIEAFGFVIGDRFTTDQNDELNTTGTPSFNGLNLNGSLTIRNASDSSSNFIQIFNNVSESFELFLNNAPLNWAGLRNTIGAIRLEMLTSSNWIQFESANGFINISSSEDTIIISDNVNSTGKFCDSVGCIGDVIDTNTQKNASGNYIFNDTTTIFSNDTRLNEDFNQTDLINAVNDSIEDRTLNKTEADLIYLNLTGTNANQNINISPNNLTIGDTFTFRLGAVLTNFISGILSLSVNLNMLDNDITNVSTIYVRDINVSDEIFLKNYNVSFGIANLMSSGLVDGGILSINADDTKFDVSETISWFVNNTDISNPNLEYVICPAFEAQTVTNIATSDRTDIGLNRDCTLSQKTTPFSNSQKRSKIMLGRLVHSNNINIVATVQLQHYGSSIYNQYVDLSHSIGNINTDGNIYSAAEGAGVNITHTSGRIFRIGANYENNKDDPNEVSLDAVPEIGFFYRFRDGSGGFNQQVVNTTLNVGFYDDGSGTLQSVGNNKYSIQRVYLFSAGQTVIQYGQAIYNKLSEATAAITTEDFEADPNLAEDAVLRAWIVVKGSTTDLTDITDTTIINAGKFGSLAGGSGTSAAQEVDLQNAYENSLEPEITLDSTNNGLTIRDASSPIGVSLFEIQNNAGTINYFNVTASGAFVNDSQVCTLGNGLCGGGGGDSGGWVNNSVETNTTLNVNIEGDVMINTAISNSKFRILDGSGLIVMSVDSANDVTSFGDTVRVILQSTGTSKGELIAESDNFIIRSLNDMTFRTAVNGVIKWWDTVNTFATLDENEFNVTGNINVGGNITYGDRICLGAGCIHYYNSSGVECWDDDGICDRYIDGSGTNMVFQS